MGVDDIDQTHWEDVNADVLATRLSRLSVNTEWYTIVNTVTGSHFVEHIYDILMFNKSAYIRR